LRACQRLFFLPPQVAARMHVRRLASHVEILTPAKINLFLEVLARRPDGYHEIETLLAAVMVFDTLVFVPTDEGEIELDCRWGSGLATTQLPAGRRGHAARELLYGEIPRGPENLVWRAAALVRERAGLRRGATIRLVKRIPAAAGLGGASSDAAAALVAANLAWSLGWSRERLFELAAELGSDVPFFLTAGAAVCRGRGERIERGECPRLFVVVVRPPVGLSTPQVYKECQPTKNAIGVRGLTESLVRGDTAQAAERMVNDLQSAAARLTPWIAMLTDEFEKQDVLAHQMSGSGSSYFGLCRSARHARRIAARLRGRNVGAVFSAATDVATSRT
jgi:4-diphosphocytidyl-2-C-methyl-D-erythritol kinase